MAYILSAGTGGSASPRLTILPAPRPPASKFRLPPSFSSPLPIFSEMADRS